MRLHSITLVGLLAAATAAAQAIDIGSRRELFVDNFLLESHNGTALVLQKPIDRGPAIVLDKPWEGAFCGYTTIIKDGAKYRAYYRGMPVAKTELKSDTVTCYAESNDGIHWTKPELGIVELMGSKKNNIILYDPAFSSDFSPFLDTRPGVPANERFKALGGTMRSGLAAFVSGDGIHWRKLREEPVFPPTKKPSFDSQNLAFYSEAEQQYVAYYRTFKPIEGHGRVRWITRSTSKDFVNWTTPVDMDFGDAPPEHLYTNQTGAYYRAPHIYVSIAARFIPKRQVLTEEEVSKAGIVEGYYKEVSDAVFFTTRGGNRYDRTFLESFVRPGLGANNWASRTNYPALNVVETGPAEMSFYVNRDYASAKANLARYTLRPDGFSSLHAGYKGGDAVTKPFRFTGSKLELNYSTSAAGSLAVELQDEAGKTVAESVEIIGDHLARNVEWKTGGDLAAYAGKPVRLKFRMKDADLFSFRFHN